VTTIAAAFVASGAPAPEAEVRRMLQATARGAGHTAARITRRMAVRVHDGAAVGAARAGWQAAPASAARCS
jgi:hypothetical protein